MDEWQHVAFRPPKPPSRYTNYLRCSVSFGGGPELDIMGDLERLWRGPRHVPKMVIWARQQPSRCHMREEVEDRLMR